MPIKFNTLGPTQNYTWYLSFLKYSKTTQHIQFNNNSPGTKYWSIDRWIVNLCDSIKTIFWNPKGHFPSITYSKQMSSQRFREMGWKLKRTQFIDLIGKDQDSIGRRVSCCFDINYSNYIEIAGLHEKSKGSKVRAWSGAIWLYIGVPRTLQLLFEGPHLIIHRRFGPAS